MDLERAGDAVRIVGGKEAVKHKHPWQAVSFKSESVISWVSGFFGEQWGEPLWGEPHIKVYCHF